MFHTWHHYAGALSGADEAIAAVGAWVRLLRILDRFF